MVRTLAKVSDVLLDSPVTTSTSKPHALIIQRIKHATQWKRVRDGLTTEDIDDIGGLLCSFEPRASAVLAALLSGKSPQGAAASVMLTRPAVDHWRRHVPEFAAAYDTCLDLGFALNYEAEAESRALAGDDDRGSVRLLERMLIARGGEMYRDKSEVVTRHIQGADAASAVFDAMKQGDDSWSVETT